MRSVRDRPWNERSTGAAHGRRARYETKRFDDYTGIAVVDAAFLIAGLCRHECESVDFAVERKQVEFIVLIHAERRDAQARVE